MWPEYKSGGWPEYCANVKFDMDELSDIMPELEQQWPSLKMPNIAFWAHEWGRHGTCAISMFPSEHDFFQAVLKLHAKLDIAAALKRSGIYPSAHTPYKAESISTAIKKAFGEYPMLHCEGDELNEVWMCISKDLSVMRCPAADKYACHGEVFIPPEDAIATSAQGNAVDVA
mmetsp:Transcript_12698/g.35719  ORF Transcript_12698/g.35719 Transcript_12698/m.35719 type:complete len:172 (+) Transcript_12698:564-1079(+)